MGQSNSELAFVKEVGNSKRLVDSKGYFCIDGSRSPSNP